MAETLTDEDLAWLRNDTRQTGPKTLRIIDAHAADRAELEARIVEVEGWYTRAMKDVQALNRSHAADRAALVAQLEELKGLVDWHTKEDAFLRAQVAEMTRERDEAGRTVLQCMPEIARLESEVTRLTEALEAEKLAHALTQSSERANAEALAAAERREKAANLDADANGERAETAEARVLELETRIDKALGIAKVAPWQAALEASALMVEVLRGK